MLICNNKLTFRSVRASADRCVVNGRTPLEWMVDRYQMKTDKASGIVNDPNEYSNDPLCTINLVKRLVTVSVRTMEIVDSLPAINELQQTASWPFAWGNTFSATKCLKTLKAGCSSYCSSYVETTIWPMLSDIIPTRQREWLLQFCHVTDLIFLYTSLLSGFLDKRSIVGSVIGGIVA